MSYLNSLFERLRSVAREVFPVDPDRTVNLTNMNKYTRMYLRRIVQRAGNRPFNFIVTDLQLARLFHLPPSKFQLWFHHDIELSKVFRRVRWFLREMIISNILEDRGELSETDVKVIPIKWPNKKTMAVFKQRTEMIRAEYVNLEAVITNLIDGEEAIGWIHSAFSSTSSFEDDNEDIGFGEDPDEVREIKEPTYKSDDSLGLNGPSIVVTDEQIREQFQHILISEKLDDTSSDDDNEVFLPGKDDLST
jgi:hypothetical protein